MNEITLIRQAGPEAQPLSPAARHNARAALLEEIGATSHGRPARHRRTEAKKRFTVRLALTATAAAAALTVAAVISTPEAPSTSVTLVAFEPASFPFTLDPLPAGLLPSFSADPGDRLIAAYRAPQGDDGVTLVVTPSKPDVAGASDKQKVTVRGRSAELMVENITEAAGAGETADRRPPVLVVQWSNNQWVEISGSGRFADPGALLAIVETLVERPQAVPLQVHLAPVAWTVLAYKDDRILTLANDGDDKQTLTVSLPPAPLPADKLLSELLGPVSPVMMKTVNNRPAQLVQIDAGGPDKGWYLQAQFPDGRTFVIQAPETFTPEQVLTVAAEVTYGS